MYAVECKQLTKEYPPGWKPWRKATIRKRALDGLDLQIQPGEIFGFLGQNGAGKTTTLKLLLSLIHPTSGEARLLGTPVHARSGVEMRRRVGYLPENPYFYEYLTGRELLRYFGRLSGLTGQTLEQRVEARLEQLGLSEAGNIALRKYSKGMLQRVGLAQAILHDPELVILDEPMSGLDPGGRREVREIILELKRQGRTVFFSTHILSDAEQLCDRVAVLEKGKLRGVGPLSDWQGSESGSREIIWRQADGCSEAALQKMNLGAAQALPEAGKYRITVTSSQLWPALDAIRAAGGEIFKVEPARPSLEAIFFAEPRPNHEAAPVRRETTA